MCTGRRSGPFWLCFAFLLGATLAHGAELRDTYSIDYEVSVSAATPTVAHVRWELSGIDEVATFRLRDRQARLLNLAGSGKFEPTANGVIWRPVGPYAHLTYDVRLDQKRGKTDHYDSYATTDWIVTRAAALFPSIAVSYTPSTRSEPHARARLIFRLPPGWHSATALPLIGPETYRLAQPGTSLGRPRGWFVLGKFQADNQELAGTMMQVIRLPGSALSASALFDFLGTTLPPLKQLLLVNPPSILIVSAPDPMWHGGISSTQSFFIHGARPLRTPDRTSPYLHELFHVLQPYRAAADADWITEGLAEYYSLELQRRANLIDDAAFRKGLGYFERFGLWHVDLTQQRDNAATNNSAPLVMYALDQKIQRATAGKQRLDDVVSLLAREGGVVDTARFQQAVSTITGKTFAKFFDRHVARGEPPRSNDPTAG